MSEEWGPWIEHDGRGIPANVVGAWCEVTGHQPWGNIVTRQGKVATGAAFAERDTLLGPRVIRYRIRKPRGLTILESLLADLPEKVDS